jgi:poly-beta-1,6-N-acetyl-D-glucosamine synthase
MIMEKFKLLRMPIFYFPLRFMIFGAFFAYIVLSNYSHIKTFEDQILFSSFQFFKIPSYIHTDLFVGSNYSTFLMHIPLHIQLLFLIFYPSLALSAECNFEKRAKILIYGVLSSIAFLMVEFLIVAVMLPLGIGSEQSFFFVDMILTSLVGAFMLELCLFGTITLPKSTDVKPIIKRNYFTESLYVAVMIIGASLLTYVIITVVKIESDSIVVAFMGLNIATIFNVRHFISYFFIETKTPEWAKKNNGPDTEYMPISFLLPAYNEEKRILRCIESIDMAASHYQGRTEIIVVNDGSTDNTRKIASEAILNLKHCSGKVYNTPNQGKGLAIKYGLERLSGDIIFRIDTDSMIDQNAIDPIMKHFKDPTVGSVSGRIFPIEEKTIWQKMGLIQNCFIFMFIKREQEVIDSITVQAGAFSVFRKDALIKIGGWLGDRLGEDGEITFRLGRYGYRNEYEESSFIHTEMPENFRVFREQRLRWQIGWFFTRASNSGIIKESNGPRTVMYLYYIYAHGLDFAHAIFLPFLFVAMFLEYNNFGGPSTMVDHLYKLFLIELMSFALLHILRIFYMHKLRRLDLLAYLLLLRPYVLIQLWFLRAEAVGILLSWSSKWKKINSESYNGLRQIIAEKVSHPY